MKKFRAVPSRSPCPGLRIGPLLAALGIACLVPATTAAQDPLRVGYAVLQTNPGTSLPVASALYSLRNPDGVLISEAGVGAVQPIRAGRILVDQRDSQTGLALANSSNQAVTLDLTLRDGAGASLATGVLVLAAGRQTAQFVSDETLFPSIPAGFVGSLTFVCRDAGRVAAVTIRQGINGHGEPVFATLPVADLDESSVESLVLPHVGAGDGLSTQIVLINRTGASVSGQIRFQASDGTPLAGQFGGVSGSVFPYSIGANGVFQGTLTSAGAIVQGYAEITVSGGSQAPVGTAIFQFRNAGGAIVSEAGVGAIPSTTAAKVFVDTVGTQTGVALANRANQAVQITFQLRDRNNLFIESVVRNVPAQGHLASFVGDLFGDLPLGFTGQLVIAGGAPIVPVTLKLTTNSRGEFILTTLPIADTTRPPGGNESVVPQVGFGTAGYRISTRLILLSPTSEAARGSIHFHSSDGADLVVEVTGVQASRVGYDLLPLGAQQFRPENKNPVALIIVDPNEPLLSEVPLSTGGSIVLRPLVIDSAGDFRDDFPMNFGSVDGAVASVGRSGLVRALSPGFSTIVTTAGGVAVVVTVSVVDISGGSQGFQISGVTPDSAGRFYLASATGNQILLTEDLSTPPSAYAGSGDMGFLDGPRPTSRFDQPTYLTLNGASGSLYVADSANNRIRQVNPGTGGAVSTLVGAGAPGSLGQTQLNNPQGVALDQKGFLWIADTNNQVIRRVDLFNGTIQTVAGQLGSDGTADGTGSEARFSHPTGIALEPVPVASALQEQPAPVSVIVTDAGSGLIRRVFETGEVTTIPIFDEPPAAQRATHPVPVRRQATMVRFSRPTGVAVDRFGVIYVSDSDLGTLFSISHDGKLVPIGGPGSLIEPRGVAISRAGILAVADGPMAARLVRFGSPSIQSVTPGEVDPEGGQAVVVTGRNFSPETRVVLGGDLVVEAQVTSSGRIAFVTPPLEVGPLPLSVRNRGGVASAELLVNDSIDDLQAGEITTFAGGGRIGRDGAVGASALTAGPAGLALDNQGNLYLAERLSHRIRSLDAVSGIVRGVAGSGLTEPYMDNAAASQATFSRPSDVAVDSAGNVFVADTANHRIRRIDANTGIVTTVAGTGQPGFGFDGDLAINQPINSPRGIATDPAGNLYIADTGNNRIRRISRDGIITTLAGNGQVGSSGDSGGAIQARLNAPESVAVDRNGNVFIADTGNSRIRRVTAGFIFAYAGTGFAGFSGDGGAPTRAALDHPEAITVDSNGSVFIADTGNNRIRRVLTTLAGNVVISTVAGGVCCPQGNGVPATESMLFSPSGVAVDAGGNIWISDTSNQRVRRVDARTGLIFTVLGGDNQGDARARGAATFLLPFDVAFDGNGNLLVADRDEFRVRRIDAVTGRATTVAGNGTAFVVGPNGPTSGVGDGGPATLATVGAVSGVAVDSRGNIYLADPTHHRVRRVDPQGTITTIAGTGVAGYSGNQEIPSPAIDSMLNTPMGVAVDRFDRIYISDNGNNLIRMVDGGGNISNIAGYVGSNPNVPPGQYGNGGSAQGANLSLLNGGKVVVDQSGAVFIADTGHNQVRRIQGPGDPFPGRIDSVATVPLPLGVALDPREGVFVSLRGNAVLRLLNAGQTRIVAGTTRPGFSGDGGPATAAEISYPVGLAFDSKGNLYIADSQNHRIRLVREIIP